MTINTCTINIVLQYISYLYKNVLNLIFQDDALIGCKCNVKHSCRAHTDILLLKTLYNLNE